MPPLDLERIREFGYKLVISPISMLLAATRAMQDVLAVIAREGAPGSYIAQMPSFAEFNRFIGLPKVRALEGEFVQEVQGATHVQGSGAPIVQ